MQTLSASVTEFRYKRGDTVKVRQCLHGRVVELLPIDASGTRSYRVRIKCPLPKPVLQEVPESDLQLITRNAVRRIVRAMPRILRSEVITGADLELITAAAKGENSGRGVLERQTCSVVGLKL